jgi:hypothetical protein
VIDMGNDAEISNVSLIHCELTPDP